MGYIKLIKYLKPYYKPIALVMVALIITSASVLSLGVGLKYLVDEGFSKNDSELLDRSLLFLLGVTVVLSCATFTRYFIITRVGDRIVADIRRDIFFHLTTLSPTFFDNEKSGGIVSRITTDTSLIQVVISSSLSVFMRNMLIMTGGIIMLVITSPKLTAYVSIIVPLVITPIILFGRRVRKLSSLTQEKVADLSSYINETVSGIKTVQAYCREDLEKEKFMERIVNILSASENRVKMRAILTAVVILLVFSSVGIVLWVGGHDVLQGKVSAGELSAFIFYSIMVSGAVGAISDVFGDVQKAIGAANGIIEIIDSEADIKSPERPKQIENNVKSELEFNNVVFFYPSRQQKAALDGISFKVRDGERVAIVGHSGAGKTTIFQLALRFYDPASGKVVFAGNDIKEYNPKDLRENFAIVSQDPIIFSATAWDNIRYGKKDASDEEVISAAKAANAYDFIMGLPNEFDTYLGEKGQRLSGGEKQRIAIARAVLRQPKILLLDEATNALDAENEKLVQDALNKIMESCTTMIIAHRFSTIKKCDRIIVVDNGKIVEEGKHDELILKRNGIYLKFAELQFGIRHKNENMTEDLIARNSNLIH